MTLPWDWLAAMIWRCGAGNNDASTRIEVLDISRLTLQQIDDLPLPEDVREKLRRRLACEQRR